MTGIYKITNKLTGKSYIGQSIHCDKRFNEHLNGYLSIDSAIRKFGIENFTFEILHTTTRDRLNFWEDYYITKYNTLEPNGYNKKLNCNTNIIVTTNSKNNHIENKDLENNNNETYLVLNWDDCIRAGIELTGTAFNLYLYLAKNQNDNQFCFNPKLFQKTFGISDKTYRNARDKLFEKGYLKKGTDNKVHFDTRGGLRETKDKIKERVAELCKKIAAKNEEKSLDFKHWIDEAKLYQIEDEKIYIIEGEKLIAIGEELLGELSVSSIEGLL